MSRKPSRFVLGFYSAEEGDPEAAYQALREASRSKVHLFPPDIASPWEGRSIERYSALLLDGESLMAAEVSPSEVEAVVKRLQGAGSPAVFVLRPVLRDDPETPKPPGELSSKASLLTRLHTNEVVLELARRDLVEAARLGHALTAAAEWMLDNAYLIRTHIAEIRRNLPRDHSKELKGLAAGYRMAEDLVAQSGQSLTENSIT